MLTDNNAAINANCNNPYLNMLCEIVSPLKQVVGECINDKDFLICIEVPIPYHDVALSVLVEIVVSIDDTTRLEAKFVGKLFALSTEDPEVFIENIFSLFSKTVEIHELGGWIISIPKGMTIGTLPKEVFLIINRTVELEDMIKFGNIFRKAILSVDPLINYLVDMINV